MSQNRKRKYGKINLFVDAVPDRQRTGGWLTGRALDKNGKFIVEFDSIEKTELAKDIMDAMNITKDNRIYIPGVGKSRMGYILLQLGYKKTLVGDIDNKALYYQQNVLNVPEKKILPHDVLIDRIYPLRDVIIDSSFLDVFLAKPGLPVQEAITGIIKNMSPSGVFICFSMNNQLIFRQLKKKFKYFSYSFLRIQLAQSKARRASSKPVRNDLSLWVCTNDENNIELLKHLNTKVSREYMIKFKYLPKLNDIENNNLELHKFFNRNYPTV